MKNLFMCFLVYWFFFSGPKRVSLNYFRDQKRYMHDEYFLELKTVTNTCELHVEHLSKLFFMALTCVSFPNM